MSLILPENVLEKLKCSYCKNYLSCGPTKIIEGYRTACGRCVSKEVGVPSLFNQVAPFTIFPCVNRYEGCNKLLQYNKVETHEKECIGGKYPCPICPPAKYPLESLQKLIHHYNQKHANFVLKTPEITISLEDMITDCHYLYCDNVNNYLFVIYLELNGEMLSCNASVAGNGWKDVIQIIDNTYRRRVCSAYNDNSTVFQIKIAELPQLKEIIFLKFLFQMDNVPALTLTDFIPPDCGGQKHNFQNWPKILFNKRIINKWGLVNREDKDFRLSNNSFRLINAKDESISIPIKCDFCENYFWNCSWYSKWYLYFDTEETQECIICVQCFENQYTTCYIHRQRFVPYFDLQLPIFNKNMLFYCRNNCGLSLLVSQLKDHEDKCFKVNDEQYVKLLFKNEISENDLKNSYYVRGNVFKRIDSNTKSGKIFMVTHDGFKIILNYKFGRFKLVIEDSHNYDISKYHVTFRIFQVLYGQSNVREEMHKFAILDYRQPHFFVVLIKRAITQTNKGEFCVCKR